MLRSYTAVDFEDMLRRSDNGSTGGTGDTAEEELLMLVAGSICKDFSSMGDGARLVGKHVSWI